MFLRLRKKQESDLTWTDLPYKEVFLQIRQSDAWVEKLNFDLVSEIKRDERLIKPTILSGFISRDGIFKCDRDFKIFYKTIVEKSIEIFFKKREKFFSSFSINLGIFINSIFFFQYLHINFNLFLTVFFTLQLI